MTKAAFLHTELVPLLASIAENQTPLWGKMKPQQMVEHMSDSLRQANGRDLMVCVTPAEQLPKMQAFLRSDKPFKENTPNTLMPDTPAPCRHSQMNDALQELQGELDEFFRVFSLAPSRMITNPFFGDLNFNDWTQLLCKHALHHLRQFGVAPDVTELV
ncbi:MAG: hypothetical protein JST36_07145 [Bacteroidetes bacterium]|nr:hypothetical protein [Bacteroidota bacterium]